MCSPTSSHHGEVLTGWVHCVKGWCCLPWLGPLGEEMVHWVKGWSCLPWLAQGHPHKLGVLYSTSGLRKSQYLTLTTTKQWIKCE